MAIATNPISTESQPLIDSLKAKVASLWLVHGSSTTGLPYHPLNPLDKEELLQAAGIIRAHAQATHPNVEFRFKHLTLVEPPKKQLVPYLLAARSGSTPEPLERFASGLISSALPDRTLYTEYVVSLTNDKVVSATEPLAGDHASLDAEEMAEAEEWLLNDPDFIEVVRKLQLPAGATVVADSWPYGTDTLEDVPRLIPYMLYFRLADSADSNHYAYPLPLLPAVDSHTKKLHSLNFTPIYGGESVETIESLWARGETFPWEKMVPAEYHHELQTEALRSDLKELEVVQRNGPSFKVDGYNVSWQKWDFRVGFNYREGMVIYDVKYDGRDIFHRLSLSEMTVPYGDPRAPFHRKQAFDLGDIGAGLCANQLDLGCDCLGLIHYFSGNLITSKGEVKHMKNVICMHEQDEGVGWKHTNYRTGNASVTRSRVLVLQTILTVANYEYILCWKFDQAANVHFETRATGILSTHAILPGETSPYGTVVSPGVLAPNHQHLFSLRIDPAIGGLGQGNTVIQEDSVPMAFDAKSPPDNNKYGVGYTVKKTPITQSGHADASPQTNRIFKIINNTQTNPISGRNIGYKLVPMPSQLMLAHPDSVAYARAEFADHHLWVTAHRDNELFAGGEYTNQSNGGARGIRSWVARNDVVEDSDLVVWHTFGLTHNPRVEDFPVLPCETHMISFKPVDFFTKSPANDVPASTQKVNRSVMADNWQGSAEVEEKAAVNHAAGNGHANGVNGKSNGSCCA